MKDKMLLCQGAWRQALPLEVETPVETSPGKERESVTMLWWKGES